MAHPHEYLAQPPSQCCFTGSIHAGTPQGVEEELAGVQTYVARPPTGVAGNGHVVFYFPDVWGLSNNAKLLMDGFAAAGFTALGIDYFRGDPISKYRAGHDAPAPPDFDQKAWRNKHFAFATAHVPVWVEAAKARFGSAPDTRYACTGYCFGAPFVLDLLATDGVSAGAVAHPSQLKEEHFRSAKQPLFLSCAEHDQAFHTEPRRKALDILMEQKTPFHEQLFYNVKHGFASRGDLSDPYERWVKEQSLQGIIHWFDFWLIRNHAK
ncbi:dienelactone hydrolase [Sporothrix brasiliensis 5110]|uniref:Dienelactone hydrolase n=1 Tax=Sporothrix brasiliensis 5110 TaxID=1398154 RepID=A0A0C2IVK7_9PEZI|nr:dienelactone hydrolase [Sporothrix brasiliensis 5110]KIH93151.1 dienelactone hydrolase [Sporothrix brasiliensis 5110]